MKTQIIPLDQLRMSDVGRVGGKNASLGEMMGALLSVGIQVPPGFATTSEAYRSFLDSNNLTKRIQEAIENTDTENITALGETGSKIRGWLLETPLPKTLERDIRAAYEILCASPNMAVSVRSSIAIVTMYRVSWNWGRCMTLPG